MWHSISNDIELLVSASLSILWASFPRSFLFPFPSSTHLHTHVKPMMMIGFQFPLPFTIVLLQVSTIYGNFFQHIRFWNHPPPQHFSPGVFLSSHWHSTYKTFRVSFQGLCFCWLSVPTDKLQSSHTSVFWIIVNLKPPHCLFVSFSTTSHLLDWTYIPIPWLFSKHSGLMMLVFFISTLFVILDHFYGYGLPSQSVL